MKLPTALLAVALLAAAGCSNPAGPDHVALAKAFDLAAGHTVEFPDGFRIKLDRVAADSRCPLDVLCITAGDATVVLNASRGGGAPVTLELHTATASQISYANYTIALTALAPYPRSSQDIPAAAYVATFVVSVR